MQLIPAIDLRGGRCVRLLRGDFAKETRYEQDPLALARHYRTAGAEWLHVVDLDGAQRGEPANLALVKRMSRNAGMKIQLGGGIRKTTDMQRALDAVDRIVIGSAAVTHPEQVLEWLEAFGPERLTLALDVRLDEAETPYVTTHGWTEWSELTLWNALDRYEPMGVKHVLCTDVSRDGAMEGPNLNLYRNCVENWSEVSFQASGGVRDASDLNALAALGLASAISGKALLEGRIRIEEMQSFLPNA